MPTGICFGWLKHPILHSVANHQQLIILPLPVPLWHLKRWLWPLLCYTHTHLIYKRERPYIQLFWVLDNWSNAFSDNSNHLCHSHLSILLLSNARFATFGAHEVWPVACHLSCSIACVSHRSGMVSLRKPPCQQFANQCSSCFPWWELTSIFHHVLPVVGKHWTDSWTSQIESLGFWGSHDLPRKGVERSVTS